MTLPLSLFRPLGVAWFALVILHGLAGMRLHAAESPAAPELTLSIFEPEDVPAWNPVDALAIQVDVRHPAASQPAASREPIVLAPRTTSWTQGMSLQVTGPNGVSVNWPFQASGSTEVEPYTLNEGSTPVMMFILDEDPARVIPPGRYQAVATLTIADGTGWVGSQSSPSMEFEVAPGPVATAPLELQVAGASALAVGDPWVVSLRLMPPIGVTGESALRSGYRFQVFDAGAREQAWTFQPAVTWPVLPNLAVREESGLDPVLAVLSPAGAPGMQPGTYRLEASWTPGGTGSAKTASLQVVVNSPATVAQHPNRLAALREQSFRWAMAVLWQAEFSTTTEIERLTREVAPLIIETERLAVELLRQDHRNPVAVLGLAETLYLAGDFDAALGAIDAARQLRKPPAEGEEVVAPSIILELDAFQKLVKEAAARAPGRVLPYLRPAVEAARLSGPDAQWASSAVASSEYRSPDYAPRQAAGAPDVRLASDSAKAWATKTADAGEEWLEVTFAQAVIARGVRVIQSYNPGAIVSLDVISDSGVGATIWVGPDRNRYPGGLIGVLEAAVPAGFPPVRKVRVILDTRRVPGWNEIDAVQLLTALPPLREPPTLSFTVLPGNPRTLELAAWPSGFVLQRASRLEPPDWVDLAATGPARVEMSTEPAFFRLMARP